jgi:hypothetical protein
MLGHVLAHSAVTHLTTDVRLIPGLIGRSQKGRRIRWRVLAVSLTTVVLAMACIQVWAHTDPPATPAPIAALSVYTDRAAQTFNRGAVGLSTETRELGTKRLGAGNRRLVRLMRSLGPSVLRIGGDTVDFSWWTSRGEPPPRWVTNTVTPQDLSALRGLLSATGWRVLLGVDFGHFEPTRAAEEVRYARAILGAGLMGVEIGNEPDNFGLKKAAMRSSTYGVGEYLREEETYRHALEATTPGVAVYGPALGQRSSWLMQLGGAARTFTELTQHFYPLSACQGEQPSAAAPKPTVAELLSPAVREQENQFLDALAQAGSAAGRPTRIGETNGIACSDSPASSPALASALWALDWILRAASSGVDGLNFHGNLNDCKPHSLSPVCTPDEAGGAATAQPEYYGLLAARQLEGGRFVPTHLADPGQLAHLATWATVGPGGTVRIAVDDFATSGSAQPLSISISGYMATAETLIDASAGGEHEITFGGAPVTSQGRWRGKPTPLHAVHSSLQVVISPASAVIITVRRKRLRD